MRNFEIERLWYAEKYRDIYIRGDAKISELYQDMSSFFRKFDARMHQTLGMRPENKDRKGLAMKDAA